MAANAGILRYAALTTELEMPFVGPGERVDGSAPQAFTHHKRHLFSVL